MSCDISFTFVSGVISDIEDIQGGVYGFVIMIAKYILHMSHSETPHISLNNQIGIIIMGVNVIYYKLVAQYISPLAQVNK